MIRSSRALKTSRAARAVHSGNPVSAPTKVRPAGRTLLVASTAAATAGALWYSTRGTVHNDAPTPVSESQKKSSTPTSVQFSQNEDKLETLVWGSNRNHVLSIDESGAESIRTPAIAAWLENVALRELGLHERHAACVDARGDVYQWGDGFEGKSGSSSGQPTRTLRGKNIIRLQLTSTRVYALSASGHIYVLSSASAQQALRPGEPTPASSPWWGTGWLWGEEEDRDFAQIVPDVKLGRREKFVAIAAGSDHLLALTSTGRTFAHPVTLKANTHGQLGFRKFDIPAPASAEHAFGHARLPIELTPKSITDPYAKATPAVRPVDVNGASAELLTSLDDRSIRFADKLFEVPALRGIDVDAIAAGARSSFAKTTAGRVLGWGANEFGQIGLGREVTLDTITVPTEVILWRSTPAGMRTTCLDVYAAGDLTFFKVERVDGSAPPYIDVLACGNGQYGGLGNAQFSNAQGTPVRTRNVSGLLEYSEKHNNLQPIMPHDISVSPTGHVLLTLDTLAHGGPGAAGRDLLSWGANYEYQLGNGKRGSSASPTALQGGEGARFMLGRRKADEVRDLQGNVWKRGVEVEQTALAGWGNSVVYWRICS
ncbi:regulator of chromosome condensation 1/beta-lactamase-inhibitor protein II [Fomitopsis serialis]|uniref:regulator of chromosome condensation 1/beta-lactamase-inhibitor protein II n=1 Tax=Fomitopsis serialis TaxID=139415 RepID=UPI002008B971|nr:regulator of chromosome condensation 1/beta-lactamase-inhibitor protein II [Neoantrodia serialis]KAH9930969.1 regulator of chromosome condensation 1/beta-lactamase-inhibitor protein II [Neoantrodia serialis]